MQECSDGGLASHADEKQGRYQCLACNQYWCKACVDEAATGVVMAATMGKGLVERAAFAAKFANGACPSCRQPDIIAVTGAAMLG